jgi:hypothetical protein
MLKKCLMVAATCLMAASALAADMVAEGSGYRGGPAFTTPTPSTDATTELAWDTGTRRWSIIWYTGAGSWVGNAFNTSTLTGKTLHVKILKFRLYSRADWPNSTWDGFRIGFYNVSGGVPGSLLWPTSGSGYFFKPAPGTTSHVWVECDINWTCPSNNFLACEEQYYNNPTADPFGIDNNPTNLHHGWQYYGGTWTEYDGNPETEPYRNIMIRVQVETGQSFPGIAPTSMGRVKALYF